MFILCFSMPSIIQTFTLKFKAKVKRVSLGSVNMYLMFMKEVSCAYQCCIYLISTVKSLKYMVLHTNYCNMPIYQLTQTIW